MSKKIPKQNITTLFWGFFLIITLFILGFFLIDDYHSITKHYFNFLKKTGYYEGIYQEKCPRFCWGNLPHDAPYFIFILIPFIVSIFAIFYYLSEDKKNFKELLKSFFTRKKSPEEIYVSYNKNQWNFSYGILIAFFLLIFIFVIIPMLIFIYYKYF